MFYIFTSENITFSKYAFYYFNNSLYFITLYIIKVVSISWSEVLNKPFIYLQEFSKLPRNKEVMVV